MGPHGQGSSAHTGAPQPQSQGKDFCPTGKRDGAGGQSPLWSIPWGPLAQGAPAVSPLWHLLPKLGPGQQPHRDPRGQCPRGEVGPWLRAPQLCAPQLRVPISADAPVHQEGTARWHNLPEGALAAHTCLQGQIRAIPRLTPLAAMGSGATLGGPCHLGWVLQPNVPSQVAWGHVASGLAPLPAQHLGTERCTGHKRGVPVAKGQWDQWDLAAGDRLWGQAPCSRLGASCPGPTQGCSHFPAAPVPSHRLGESPNKSKVSAWESTGAGTWVKPPGSWPGNGSACLSLRPAGGWGRAGHRGQVGTEGLRGINPAPGSRAVPSWGTRRG